MAVAKEMNTAEKIAAAYLRLNGFFLLPLFTVFDGEGHNHFDLLGLRAANSCEQVGGFTFPTDDNLFKALSTAIGVDGRSKFIGVITQVKTDSEQKPTSAEHRIYAKRFVGDANCVAISFHGTGKPIFEPQLKTVSISPIYAFDWILKRFSCMDKEKIRLTKNGSWTWSEEFLSDILVLRKYGFLEQKRE